MYLYKYVIAVVNTPYIRIRMHTYVTKKMNYLLRCRSVSYIFKALLLATLYVI